jgi:hypothetical protein
MKQADPLPTEEQRRLLCEMMASAFVEIRFVSWGGKAQQAADLADAFHNVPREMYGWGNWSRRIFRGMLESYERKYHDATGKYVKMFDAIFGPPSANEPVVECWLPPWQAVEPTAGAALEVELRKELSSGHPLFAKSLLAIGRRSDQDDVLFLVQGELARLAVVHLTWRSTPEPDPQWPNTEFFDGEQDWVARCLVVDHAEWRKADTADHASS